MNCFLNTSWLTVVSLSSNLLNCFMSIELLSRLLDIKLSNSSLSLILTFWVIVGATTLLLLGVLTLVLVVVYFF